MVTRTTQNGSATRPARRRLAATAAVAAAFAGAAAAAAPEAEAAQPAQLAEPRHVAGEVIVGLRDSVGAREISSDLSSVSTDRQKIGSPGLLALELRDRVSVKEAAEELEAQPGVRFVEPNYIRTIEKTPDDPRIGEQWGLTQISAAGAWDAATGSSDTKIVVVDDGIALDHADLAANIWSNPGESGSTGNGKDEDGSGYADDVRGWDFVDEDNDPSPVGADSYHGTHVAGIAAAVGDNGTGISGTSWAADLIPARIFDESGTATAADVVEAYAYAARIGAPIVNGSFGGYGYSQAEYEAIQAASDVLFVVAAGNEALPGDLLRSYPCGYDLANVICVAASTQSDALASFSNYGTTTIDLAAPGEQILSTVPGGYGYIDGTSMATPFVTGTAALVLSKNPGLTPAQLRSTLLGTVDAIDSLEGRVATGGRLNAAAALGATTAAEADPPETKIDRAPTKKIRKRRTSFRFSSSISGATFQCRTDDERGYRSCTSPTKLRRLKRGGHRFRVRAVSSGTVDPSPAVKRFRVVK